VLGRPAAERFVAVVPEPDAEAPRLLAELCRRARDVLAAHPDSARGIDLRVGYAVFPDDGVDAEGLEARAAEGRIEAL